MYKRAVSVLLEGVVAVKVVVCITDSKGYEFHSRRIIFFRQDTTIEEQPFLPRQSANLDGRVQLQFSIPG